jgi:hypothetical protein
MLRVEGGVTKNRVDNVYDGKIEPRMAQNMQVIDRIYD